MISWEEYIKSNILEFRKLYEGFSKELKKFVEEDAAQFSLNKPCQIVAFDFAEPYPLCFIVLHSQEFPDMEIVVLENVAFEEFRLDVLKTLGLMKPISDKELEKITESILKISIDRSRDPDWTLAFDATENSSLFHLRVDPRVESDRFARYVRNVILLKDFTKSREEEKEKVDKTVDDIRREAEAIPETELRTKMIEATERLEGQIEQLDKRVEGEINVLRSTIGRSEKFLDWKAFYSDVEHLKETHMTKETLEAQFKRLDEKIDKGLEALHTRIEDLKTIKFWSKRTILEIALVIWGTIVTLIAAGIIKF